MDALTIAAIIIFSVSLFYMSLKCGTQESISQLAAKYRWLLLITLLSQMLLLPQMFYITPENLKWVAFLGVGGIVICGSANVLDKADETVHVVAAIATFVLFSLWVLLVNRICILPTIICALAGKEKWKWRTEIGLIISVYMTLLLSLT